MPLDVGGVIVVDHLDARPALVRDLVYFPAFHEAHADVGVSEAICGASPAIAINLQPLLTEDRVEPTFPI